MKRFPIFVGIGIFCVALLAAVIVYPSTMVGGDEGRYILDASRIDRGEIPIANYTTRTPLLLYSMHASKTILGPSLFTYRLPGILFSALTAVFLALLGWLLFSGRVGIVAGLLFALQPFTLWNGVVPKSETLTVLFMTASVASLVMARISNERKLWWFFAGFALGLGYVERQSAIILAFLFAYRAFDGSDRHVTRKTFHLLAIAVLGFFVGFGICFAWVASQNISRAVEFWFTPFLLDAVQAAKGEDTSLVVGTLYSFVRDWALTIGEAIAIQYAVLFVACLFFLWGVVLVCRAYSKYKASYFFGIIIVSLYGFFVVHSVTLIRAGHFHPSIFLVALILVSSAIIWMLYQRELFLSLGKHIYNTSSVYSLLLIWIFSVFVLYSLLLPGYTRELIPAITLFAAVALVYLWDHSKVFGRVYLVFLICSLWCIGAWWFLDNPRTGGWWWQQETITQTATYLREHTYHEEEIFAAGQLPVVLADRRVFMDLNSYSMVFAENFESSWGTFPAPRKVLETLRMHPPRFILVDGRMNNHFFEPYPVFHNFVKQHYEKVESFGSGKRRDWIEIWKYKQHPRIAWTFQTGDEVETSALVHGGRVYMGSEDGFFYALDAKTGVLIWKIAVGAPIVRSSAVAVGDVLIFGAEDGHVHAVSFDGRALWSYDAGAPVRASAVLDGRGTIYIGSRSGAFLALASDGKKIWEADLGSPITATAVIKNDTLYVNAGEYLMALNAQDGKERWRFATGALLFSTPTATGDTIYVSNEAGSLFALDIHGKEIWRFQVPSGTSPNNGFESSPFVMPDGTVVVGSKNHRLYAIDTAGHERWLYEVGWEIESSPRMYGADIFFGAEDYRWYRLTGSGSLKDVVMTDGQVDSSAIFAGGVAYFGSQDGRIYAYRLE